MAVNGRRAVSDHRQRADHAAVMPAAGTTSEVTARRASGVGTLGAEGAGPMSSQPRGSSAPSTIARAGVRPAAPVAERSPMRPADIRSRASRRHAWTRRHRVRSNGGAAGAQTRRALARWRPGPAARSVGEEAMTRRISAVAVCCSSASAQLADCAAPAPRTGGRSRWRSRPGPRTSPESDLARAVRYCPVPNHVQRADGLAFTQQRYCQRGHWKPTDHVRKLFQSTWRRTIGNVNDSPLESGPR